MAIRPPTRLDAVKAGWEFPGYVGALKMMEEAPQNFGTEFAAEVNFLKRNLERVFQNPAFPLSRAVEEYKLGRGSNEVLKTAFFGLPDYIFLWFRVGQTCVSAADQISRAGPGRDPSVDLVLVAVSGNLAAAGIPRQKREHILNLIRRLAECHDKTGFEYIEIVRDLDATLLSCAIEEDRKIMRPNPWLAGSFYLFSIISVIVCLRVVAGPLHPIWIPIVVISGILSVTLIGVMTLRTNEQLKDRPFVELVRLVISSLPRLIGAGGKKRTSDDH
jgi:hypothetical protein